jgi:hypothetical protein
MLPNFEVHVLEQTSVKEIFGRQIGHITGYYKITIYDVIALTLLKTIL